MLVDRVELRLPQRPVQLEPAHGRLERARLEVQQVRPTRHRAPDHPDIVNEKPLVGLNRWPEDMPEFRAATTSYYQAMEAMTTIARTILNLHETITRN